jgi:transcriptional regulator with XRE-family HTH domain
MSLGDELRLLRAKAGGITPSDIEEATGVDAGLYSQIEQRYREMGDDETVERLAAFFGCQAEPLKQARARSRKALSRFLAQALESGDTVEFELRTGDKLMGQVGWWDLGSLGLEPTAGGSLIVVQRHAIINW